MAEALFNVLRVDVVLAGKSVMVVKYADDGNGEQVEIKSETDKTEAELLEYFQSRGWYYTGHSSRWNRDARRTEHVFGYMPKAKGATRLTVKAPVWVDPWGDAVVGA